MHVVIFEDSRWPLLAPSSLARPVFCMSSGAGTLLDSQLRFLKPTRLTLWVRPGLETFCRHHMLPGLTLPVEINAPLDDQPAILLNGRSFFSAKFDPPGESAAAVDGEDITAARVIFPGLAPNDALTGSARWFELLGLPRFDFPGHVASYLWDLIGWNEAALIRDAACSPHMGRPKAAGPYHLLNDSAIALGDVLIAPGVVIDATKGPVVIEDAVALGAHSVIIGPCHIGRSATISPHALIRGGSIGTLCKIGGEVSNSIFMPCSNKAHEGFVGDSYIGQWVNFGAGATTSNLKNTYGEISVRMGSQTVSTGRRFLGALVGDHTKFAIGTRLMTGSYIGHCCMIAASSLTPTYVPSFTFLSDKGSHPYDRGKAKEVMTAVFQRRHREWQAGDDEMLEFTSRAAAVAERR